MTAGAEDGSDRVTDAALQRASGKPPVGLHVPDLGARRRLRSFAISGEIPRLVPLIRPWWSLPQSKTAMGRYLIGQDGALLQANARVTVTGAQAHDVQRTCLARCAESRGARLHRGRSGQEEERRSPASGRQRAGSISALAIVLGPMAAPWLVVGWVTNDRLKRDLAVEPCALLW